MKERNNIGFKMRILSNLIKRDVEAGKRQLGIELPNGVNGWAISYFYDNMDKEVIVCDCSSYVFSLGTRLKKEL